MVISKTGTSTRQSSALQVGKTINSLKYYLHKLYHLHNNIYWKYRRTD